MEERKITNTQMESYHQYLIREEKSTATVEKYLRDARAFVVYVGGEIVTKEVVMAYKKELHKHGKYYTSARICGEEESTVNRFNGKGVYQLE